MGPEASLEGVGLLRKSQEWKNLPSTDLEAGLSGRRQSEGKGPEVGHGAVSSRTRREGR